MGLFWNTPEKEKFEVKKEKYFCFNCSKETQYILYKDDFDKQTYKCIECEISINHIYSPSGIFAVSGVIP